MKIVTVFAQPIERATGYIYKDDDENYSWGIGGVGLGGVRTKTEIVPCPFLIPHDDFAAGIATAYFNAIAKQIGGGDYGNRRALDLCFGFKA